MESATLDVDDTIDDLQRIADGLLRHYPTWTLEQRTQLAAQLMQASLLRECLAQLASMTTTKR